MDKRKPFSWKEERPPVSNLELERRILLDLSKSHPKAYKALKRKPLK